MRRRFGADPVPGGSVPGALPPFEDESQGLREAGRLGKPGKRPPGAPGGVCTRISATSRKVHLRVCVYRDRFFECIGVVGKRVGCRAKRPPDSSPSSLWPRVRAPPVFYSILKLLSLG